MVAPTLTARPNKQQEEPLVPPEVEQILRDFAKAGENGQVILNLNRGAIESYKTVRYVRVIDKGDSSKRQ